MIKIFWPNGRWLNVRGTRYRTGDLTHPRSPTRGISDHLSHSTNFCNTPSGPAGPYRQLRRGLHHATRSTAYSMSSSRRLVLASSMSSDPSPDRMVLVAYRVKPLSSP